MAWSRVTGDVFGGAGANGGSTSPGVNTSGADTLFIVEGKYAGGTLQAPTDAYSNIYTGLTALTSFEPYLRIWYKTNAAVGSNHTVTSNGGSSYPSFEFEAWAGGDLSSPFDQQVTASGSGTSLASGNTPNLTADDELVIVGTDGYLTDTSSVDTGFTLRNHVAYGPSNNESSALATKVLSGGNGSPTSATANYAGSAAASQIAVASFKAAAGGGGGGSSIVPIVDRQYRARWAA